MSVFGVKESNSDNKKILSNSVAKRKPMQIKENRCDVAEPRLLCNHPSKSILDKLKASQIWNKCASQERVAEIKSGANYCCSYGFCNRIAKVKSRPNQAKVKVKSIEHITKINNNKDKINMNKKMMLSIQRRQVKQKLSRPKPPMVRLNKLRWTDNNNIRLIINACYNDFNDSISNI